MKTKTIQLLECLKRQRSHLITPQHFADLAADVAELGEVAFRDAASRIVCPPKSKRRSAQTEDDLLVVLKRYQRQSGLNMQNFISEVERHRRAANGDKPTKANLSSGPKYLQFLRTQMPSMEIENAFGNVLKEYF